MKKVIIFIVLVAVLLSSCVGGGPSSFDNNRKANPDGVVYELFYIEGMPCMRVGRGNVNAVWSYDGVTCDWSKWEGNK